MTERSHRTAVRRRDRMVEDDAWIAEFLRRTPVGVMATVAGGEPFLNSNLFVYDEARHAIYLHTARHGRTRDNVVSSRCVSFAAFALGRLLPAKTALEFSAEFESVTVFGEGTIVEDRDEARGAMELLMAKYAPHLRFGVDYGAITDEDLDRTTVFRISVEEWVGKKKQVEPDFPGAFVYTFSQATRTTS